MIYIAERLVRLNCSPILVDHPTISADRSPKSADRSPKSADRSPKSADRSPKSANRSPKSVNCPPKSADSPPKSADSPPKSADRSLKSVNCPPKLTECLLMRSSYTVTSTISVLGRLALRMAMLRTVTAAKSSKGFLVSSSSVIIRGTPMSPPSRMLCTRGI